jgi:hypothetical protein
LVGEFEAGFDDRQPQRNLFRAGKLGHPRWVEEDRRRIVGHRRRTGVGVRDPARVLFQQLEATGVRRRKTRNKKRAGKRRQTKRISFHE